MSGLGLTLHCPAKLNLCLYVGPPNVSGQHAGFHPIASWMVAIDFGDTLELSRLQDDESSLWSRVIAKDAPQAIIIDWPIESDLIYRAHEVLEKHIDRPLPIRAELTKRVPAGSGLGGGSADAAGVLIGCNDLFGLGLSQSDLLELAAEVGSDVAFSLAAMTGRPAAIATGLGERIRPIDSPPGQTCILLILPPFGCDTRKVYQQLDQFLQTNIQDDDVAELRLSESLEDLAKVSLTPDTALHNDLMQAACFVQPELKTVHRACVEILEQPVHLTGSGSTLFAIFDGPSQAKAKAEQLRKADRDLATVVSSIYSAAER